MHLKKNDCYDLEWELERPAWGVEAVVGGHQGIQMGSRLVRLENQRLDVDIVRQLWPMRGKYQEHWPIKGTLTNERIKEKVMRGLMTRYWPMRGLNIKNLLMRGLNINYWPMRGLNTKYWPMRGQYYLAAAWLWAGPPAWPGGRSALTPASDTRTPASPADREMTIQRLVSRSCDHSRTIRGQYLPSDRHCDSLDSWQS